MEVGICMKKIKYFIPIVIVISIILIIVLKYITTNSNNTSSDYNTIINTNNSINDNAYILNDNVQYSIGVNTHFLNADINEINRLYGAGFKTIRTDLTWASIEKSKGIYDFSKYDALELCMEKYGINIIFILDYGNPLYDNGFAPYSDNGRVAFANFAKAAIKHYKGKHIIWEIWNEANDESWKPKANIDNYCKLVIETIKSIKSVDEDAFIIAPALAGIDYNFLNQLGKNQIFKYIDGISIHPYRKSEPETVVNDYNKVRSLIYKYPHKENIKIFCSEWGYSTTWENIDEMKQAQYCIREYLINLMCKVNLTIWYDWKDDGNNKSNMEHNFGVVHKDLTPKITYNSIRTLTTTLKDYKFVERINDGQDSDYILVFQKGNSIIYVLWTTEKEHNINIKMSENNIKILDIIGNSQKYIRKNGMVEVKITNSVIYVRDSTN